MAAYLEDARAALARAGAPIDPDASDEAVRWFRNRVPLPPAQWRALDRAAQRRAFTVAGATGLDVLETVWRAIDRAVAQGTRFVDFKRDVGTSLRDAWAGTDPARLAVVFRNNVQSAYAAGRYAQMRDPDVLADRPWWRFEAILDARTTPICRPLEGVTKRADDPWWSDHYPPLHHQCRSAVSALTDEQSVNERHDVPDDAADPQPGWGDTPDLAEWAPRADDYPPELWRAFVAWRGDE